MTWTYSRHIHLSVRHPWGRVWVDAYKSEDERLWSIEASVPGLDGPTWRGFAIGSRAVAKKAMQDLAARLAAHIEQASGGA